MELIDNMPVLRMILASAFLALSCAPANAQQVFTNDKIDYAIELPSTTWRIISEPGAAHENIEFVYGDRLDGYLQIRK